MPKNIQGGKNYKKSKRKTEEVPHDKINLTFAKKGQTYAQVIKRAGGKRLDVLCADGKLRSAIIPGKFIKRVWMFPGDILLVSLDYDAADNTCTIDRKYNNTEASILKSTNIIQFENLNKNNVNFNIDKKDNDIFEFTNI